MKITIEQIKEALGNVSVTFAQVEFTSSVKVAAKHKDQKLKKHTKANIILFNNVRDYASIYKRRVQKSAAKYSDNDRSAVENFSVGESYFEHTDCFCIVRHKKDPSRQYLYAMFNNSKSHYTHNDNVVSKEYVAEYMTPSGKRDLLGDDNSTINVANGVRHDVRVRTILPCSITKLKIRKQILLRT